MSLGLALWLGVAQAGERSQGDGGLQLGVADDDAWARGIFSTDSFALGFGAALVRFDVNAKFTNKESGRFFYIDTEGTFDLPEVATVGTYYGAYKFNQKHSIGFSYFNIRRSSTLIDIDKPLGDVRVRGDLTLSDTTDFFMLRYGYALLNDSRAMVNLMLGIYTIDLEYMVQASGEISDQGTVVSRSREHAASAMAPLPLVGIDTRYKLTPEWVIASDISLVGGTYQDISALVTQTTITALYQFNRHVGGMLGITYFNADVLIDEVDIDEEPWKARVGYGYDGAFLGLHFIW